MTATESGTPPAPTSTTPWPIGLKVTSDATHLFGSAPTVDSWGAFNYLVGPNGSGKTTFFKCIMEASRRQWPRKVKVLGTGRLGPLEPSVARWIGETKASLFQEENIENVYNQLFGGMETAHEAFLILEKRLDLRLRITAFLKHVFGRAIHLEPSRQGLQVFGASDAIGKRYAIVDECHGLKELITVLTFLYDDTFSVLGIDEPELHLHPQFQRFLQAELRKYSGDPGVKGRKLIFLVTHSPIFLELRSLEDIASILLFPGGGAPPVRFDPRQLGAEEQLKVRHALPSFHAAQREVLFSHSPVLVEGPSDHAILSALTAKLHLPLGAAGIGLSPMGGKTQLFAYRTLLKAFSKPGARFVLDLDAALDAQTLRSIEHAPEVQAHLTGAGNGGRTLTQEVGELIQLIRKYAADLALQSLRYPSSELADRDPSGDISRASMELSPVLRALQNLSGSALDATSLNPQVLAIRAKFSLIRAAAEQASVLLLDRGPIEAYFESPPPWGAKDYTKQEALQHELTRIWETIDVGVLKTRYQVLLDFIGRARLLEIPIGAIAADRIAALVNDLQSEIVQGRVKSKEEAAKHVLLESRGYWHVCELTSLTVSGPQEFSGTIRVKSELGGAEYHFDEGTLPYTIAMPRGPSPNT